MMVITSSSKKMVVFHSAYTIPQIITYGLEAFVVERDSTSFFDEVITINSVAFVQEKHENYKEFGYLGFIGIYQPDNRNIVIDVCMPKRISKLPLFVQFLLAHIIVMAIVLRVRTSVIAVRAEDPRLNGIIGLLAKHICNCSIATGIWGNPRRIRREIKKPLMPKLFRFVWLEELVERVCIKQSEILLVQNAENHEFLNHLFVDTNKVFYFPVGLTISPLHKSPHWDPSFSLNREINIDPRFTQRIIVCISRLESLKRIEHAVYAFSEVVKGDNESCLVIVGEGTEKENLLKLAEGLGVNERVSIVGGRNQYWISQLLQRCNLIFALLSGRALLESSLYGIPTVAYNVDWHSEIIKHGETGMLVTDLDWNSLARTSLEIFQMEDEGRSLGAALLASAKSRVNSSNNSLIQIELYTLLTT